jgi:hypothetical protein
MDLVDASGNQIIDPSLLDQPTPINFTDPDVRSYVVPHAVEPESADRLWTLSEDLIKH